MLPSGLTYTELIPEHLREPLLHAPVFYNDEDDLFRKLRKLLMGESKGLPLQTLRNVNAHLDWKKRIAKFDDLFETIQQGNS